MKNGKGEAPVWFVTGCSSGFGREIARAAAAHGFRVVATARNIKALDDLVAEQPDRFLALTLDVTKINQVNDAVEKARDRFGHIDVLVNNAGYGYLAAVEEGDDRDVRALFETNFFGLVAMTRAVLPDMRARRQGMIVNIASVAGLVGFPGSGYYAATKFAVEGFSESLAQEVEPLGLHVLLVEPGPFRTDWAGRSLKQSPRFIEAYKETADRRRLETTNSSGRQAGDPARAAEAIIQAVRSPTPPRHLVLGREGVENAEKQMKSILAEIDRWRHTSLAADFPTA